MTPIFRFLLSKTPRTFWISFGTVGLACIFWASNAQALKVIEHDKFYVYFPKDDAQLAERLLDAHGPMTAFLENRGLPVAKPLHIVLDDMLDEPGIRLSILPHREIRIPIRAPGVMEDGSTEPDPWIYYLFMGLAAHGIYQERSGIPKAAYRLMGELISPNVILPHWGVDGIAFLLYEKYQRRSVSQPFAEALLTTIPIPDLDLVSHHPDIWPGRHMFRIFGRPFIRWLHDRWGWEKMLTILKLHGGGILPVEIDREAHQVFGMGWPQLWGLFQEEHYVDTATNQKGLPITGYWQNPMMYWHERGLENGVKTNLDLGRYGYRNDNGDLWLSGYDSDGVAKLLQIHNSNTHLAPQSHLWDPGPGRVAVTRIGSRPYLTIRSKAMAGDLNKDEPTTLSQEIFIEAPADVIQLSGPMMDEAGRVVVAANTAGNWDIWIHDDGWYRLTHAPSVELDPWLSGNNLVFASNASGRFQIHSQGMQQLTDVATQAVLPRGNTYLQLAQNGLEPIHHDGWTTISPLVLPEQDPSAQGSKTPIDTNAGGPYSIWPSLKTNYLIPDIFIDPQDFQIGLATKAHDITRDYGWDAGIRYASQSDAFSWRLGGRARNFSGGLARYPFGYTPVRTERVSEMRWDFTLAWSPPKAKFIGLSANYRLYRPYPEEGEFQDEGWAAVKAIQDFGDLQSSLNLEFFTNTSMSISGELRYLLQWPQLATNLRLQAGKTWGQLNAGHNTFRIGGNTGEGFFTRRTPRLFPVRGFDADILDAGQAVAGGVELQWPLANLQTGYKTLPLFIRDIILVTFMDAGLASEEFTTDDMLVGIGVEAVTGLELAWILNTEIRIGLAWPLVQPDDLQQEGPTFLIQVGQPL